MTFPFPGKPGTWASLPDRQGGGHLAGPGRPAEKNPLFESGASLGMGALSPGLGGALLPPLLHKAASQRLGGSAGTF